MFVLGMVVNVVNVLGYTMKNTFLLSWCIVVLGDLLKGYLFYCKLNFLFLTVGTIENVEICHILTKD